MKKKSAPPPPVSRSPLNQDRVVKAAVALADKQGIDALNMRNLAQELGVVPMAIYKHVTNKEELLTHMVDLAISEIDSPPKGIEWKQAVREQILSARKMLLRHRWASKAIESQSGATPIVLTYMNSLIGLFIEAGIFCRLNTSCNACNRKSNVGIYTRGISNSPPPDDPAVMTAIHKQLSEQYPYIITIATAKGHDEDTSVDKDVTTNSNLNLHSIFCWIVLNNSIYKIGDLEAR